METCTFTLYGTKDINTFISAFKIFSNGNCNKGKTEGKGQTCIPESIVAIATSAASLIV
jgi:hypothetical protein